MDWIVKLSPRALLIFAILNGCVAFAEAQDKTQTAIAGDEQQLPTSQPAANLWQFGTNRLTYWSGEDPLINLLQVNTGNADWPADVFDREAQSFHKVLGQYGFDIGLIRNGAKLNPGYYAGDYIIDWQGDGRVGVKLNSGQQSREGPNRVRERFSGTASGWGSVAIMEINSAEGVHNIRVYRAEHEAALKAGKIFNPDFVKLVARYDIVRAMDWNSGGRVSRADQIAQMSAQYWGAGVAPLEAQFKLAEEAGVALWMNAPARLGAPDGLDAQLTAISDQRQRWALIGAQFDTVAASKEWDNYATALVAAMEATGYPQGRHFYLELANETWNWGGPFGYATEWYFALTHKLAETTGTKYAANPVRGAYGYFSAQLAEAFARALEAAGRSEQQWTLVIGTQTAWDAHTVSALQGVRDYNARAGGGGALQQPMARFGVAATGYYAGVFADAAGANEPGLFGAGVKGDAWRTEWLRRLDADPQAFAQFLYDYMAGPAPQRLNVAWVVAQSKLHRQAAEGFGARFIGQYEGSSHDILDRALVDANPKALAFYKAWQQGPHHAALIRLHATSMREAFPSVILSNYQHWSDSGIRRDAPWIFNPQWGEETDAERALFEVVGK